MITRTTGDQFRPPISVIERVDWVICKRCNMPVQYTECYIDSTKLNTFYCVDCYSLLTIKTLDGIIQDLDVTLNDISKLQTEVSNQC